ncbi:MFS transporter [Acidianus hospitalis]|uniref:MFS transporter n=1 Tax=Acidianus hospitalis TaxID=563177 RepID=A0A2T9X3U1_9CREN|nr:MFS transporter [Acidianus hospitalis]
MNNKEKRSSAIIIFITSLSFFLSYFSRIAWGIVSVYSSLKPTEVQDSIIFSLFFIGYVIVQIPSGFIANSYPKITSVTSLLGLSFASFLSGYANSITFEYFSSILMGLFAGWIYPTTIKILSCRFSGKELPVAIGYYSLAWPLSIVLSGITLPYLSINFGWRFPYYLISMISFLTALSYLLIPIKKSKIERKSIFTVARNRNVIIVSFSGFLFFLSYWIITLYTYKYFLTLGMNSYIAGLAYSMLALAGIPSTIIAGYIIRRVGIKNSLTFFEGIYGLLTLNLSYYLSIIQVFIVACTMGFVRFIITPANSSAVSMIDRKNAGSISGFANFFWQSSGIVAPLFASMVIASLGFKILWLFSGFIIILSSTIYLFLLKIKE